MASATANNGGAKAGTLPFTSINNVKIYNVSGQAHKSLPDWLARRHARSLKKDSAWSRRIELVQDFEFPTACTRLRASLDGRYIIGTGTYKPQFRVWELGQAALKFERHTTCETMAFDILSEDYSLLALVQQDRSIEVHEAKGLRYRTKIPKAGRDVIFDRETSDLLISTSKDLQILNLELGQFKEPLETASGINTCKIGPGHGLYALALDGGTVEFWDRRDGQRAAALAFEGDATALHFINELTLAVGTSEGQVSLLDLRAPRPHFTKDHQNGFGIRGIYSQGDNVISWDKKAIKIWTPSTSSSLAPVVTLEPGPDINDVIVQSGFVGVALEESKIASYLIPNLGPAPRWASYLEHLTEEMEEASGATRTYDNYKFVDKKELASLGLDHLIGSKLLRAYMHGYLMDLRLYEQARAVANPFAYEEYIAKQKAEKLDRERASRIIPVAKTDSKKAAKVNARAAQNDALRGDDRFGALFQDADFQIDEESEEWRASHPHNLGKHEGEDDSTAPPKGDRNKPFKSASQKKTPADFKKSDLRKSFTPNSGAKKFSGNDKKFSRDGKNPSFGSGKKPSFSSGKKPSFGGGKKPSFGKKKF